VEFRPAVTEGLQPLTKEHVLRVALALRLL
jgi:hypothetical protein